MRRTALALFVVEPTHLRCGKLNLIQAKSKFRLGDSVGGFAAGCIARKLSRGVPRWIPRMTPWRSK